MSREDLLFTIKGTYEHELKEMLHMVNISQVRDSSDVFFDTVYDWYTMLLPDMLALVKPTYEEISREIAAWFKDARERHLNTIDFRMGQDVLYKRNGVKLKMKIVEVIHFKQLWLRIDKFSKVFNTSGGATSKTLKKEEKISELLSSEIT